MPTRECMDALVECCQSKDEVLASLGIRTILPFIRQYVSMQHHAVRHIPVNEYVMDLCRLVAPKVISDMFVNLHVYYVHDCS